MVGWERKEERRIGEGEGKMIKKRMSEGRKKERQEKRKERRK